MAETIYMDDGEKSSDGVVKILEEDREFADEGYRVERARLRAVQCPCGKWYHALLDLGYKCPVCGVGEDKAVDSERVADFSQASGKWAIEKKLSSNYYSSLKNKEIYPQLEKLGAVYGTSACIAFQGYMSLLIEQYPALSAWISSIQAAAPLRYGVPFTIVEDDIGMARLIDAYVKQARHDGVQARFKIDEVKKESSKLAGLRANKGVGDAIGIKAFIKFGNITNMANATRFDLESVFHSKTDMMWEFFHGDGKQEMLDLIEERRKKKEERDAWKANRNT